MELNNERRVPSRHSTAARSAGRCSLLIFQDLTFKDIYILTLLSKRMRSLALPSIYLAEKSRTRAKSGGFSVKLEQDSQASAGDLSALW